jgi:hypothetical protein
MEKTMDFHITQHARISPVKTRTVPIIIHTTVSIPFPPFTVYDVFFPKKLLCMQKIFDLCIAKTGN